MNIRLRSWAWGPGSRVKGLGSRGLGLWAEVWGEDSGFSGYLDPGCPILFRNMARFQGLAIMVICPMDYLSTCQCAERKSDTNGPARGATRLRNLGIPQIRPPRDRTV